jgi:hypothetical protein
MNEFRSQPRKALPPCGIVLALLLTAVASSRSASASQLEELAARAGVRILARGTSESEVERNARAGLPLKLMNPAGRARANEILNRTSQYRRLPEVLYPADQSMYRYLVEHPDVAVSSWRALGISQFQMWQTGPLEYEAEAADGSEGIADILYRDQNHCLFICEGKYQNPLLPRSIEAAALVWFQYSFSRDADGKELVRQTADVFVTFPSQSVATIARVLSPVTNTLLDRNLYEVTLYASMMSRAVLDEPGWVIQLAQQLEGVLPSRPAELISIARVQRPGRPRMSLARPRPGINPAQLLPQGIQLFEPPHQFAAEVQPRIADGTTIQSFERPPTMPIAFRQQSVSSVGKPSAPPQRVLFRRPADDDTAARVAPARTLKRDHSAGVGSDDQLQLQKEATPPVETPPAAAVSQGNP